MSKQKDANLPGLCMSPDNMTERFELCCSNFTALERNLQCWSALCVRKFRRCLSIISHIVPKLQCFSSLDVFFLGEPRLK